MRVRFLMRQAFPQGGLTLAVFRLAEALVEAGHDAGVVLGQGEPPPEPSVLVRRLESPFGAQAVAHALEREAPDLVLVCEDSPEWLRASAAAAPTLIHTHMHWGACADATRYWHRLSRPCAIRAGWRCAAVRPLLGCSDLRRTLEPQHVARQVDLLELLVEGVAGVVCVSTDQAELYVAQGVPASRVAVVPNLGIRLSPDELRTAAAATPEGWRRAVAYFGRLTKAKGVALLPRIADSLDERARLRVFGEGYLAEELKKLPQGVVCGQIEQSQVAGVLMWARAVVFPSLWPEPGGIVGVDAQIMDVPLAAFDVGAARYWPHAAHFSPGQTQEIASWVAEVEPPSVARDPDSVAARQAAYWARIAEHASCSFRRYMDQGAFARSGGLAEALLDLGEAHEAGTRRGARG